MALKWLDAEYVRDLFDEPGATIVSVEAHLRESYPEQSGISVASLKRFMHDHSIARRQRLTDAEVVAEVRKATEELGSAAGRKSMQGYLRSKGIFTSQRRISSAQTSAASVYQANRRNGTERRLNPQTYRAPFFGYNLHFDQNEKCVRYGVVFVVAVDGQSAYLVRGAVMPRKNNEAIYRDVFAPAVEEFGLWDQVICDGGLEFVLTLYIQHYLDAFRIKPDGTHSNREVYRQLKSTANNRVERIWGEVNQRLGFFLKEAFVDLENRGLIDIANPLHQYACSTVGCTVAQVLMERLFNTWNHKTIPGKGIPFNYIADRGNYSLPPDALPTTEQAVQLYTGQLTNPGDFGVDLLEGRAEIQQERNIAFWHEVDITYRTDEFSGLEMIANNLVNSHYQPFQNSVLRFIEMTTAMFV